MFKVTRHTSAQTFLHSARAWLMRAEAENNLMLGFTEAWARDPAFFKAAPYLASVELDGNVVACAFRAPPHKLALTRAGDAAAMRSLAADALALYPDLDIAFGPEPDVDAFAAAWAELSGRRIARGMRTRIHEIRALLPRGNRPPGRLRAASAADLDVVVPWMDAFLDAVGDSGREDPARLARSRLRDGALYVWDDHGPVSMAGWSGKTQNGVRVNLVYTPPELRSKGYAFACVSGLTELLLAQGNRFCCLYTNLANPISNRIYERIGYRPLCDVGEFTATRPN